MNLIAIAIALATERFLSRIRRWREYDWFGRYLYRLRWAGIFTSLWRSSWGLSFLLPPLLAVAALQHLLQGGVWSLAGLVFAVAVLVFALGPRDLWEDVRELIAAREEGKEARVETLAASLCDRRDPTEGELVRAVVIAGHERVFGVLVWFFVLGPLGAVLYRLASALPAQAREADAGEKMIEAAMRLHALLAWVPQRVTALLYGLAGSSDDALAGWRRAREAETGDWSRESWHLLAETGCGALQMEEGDDHRVVELGLEDRLREALGLVTRSLILLLAVFAAFTIGGWLA